MIFYILTYMKMPLYIISDNHFMLESSKLEKERRKKLFKLFDKIKKTGGTLILGGDFFDFWIEFKNGIPHYYQDILDELEILSNHKIEIHYVLGNHDYWDFGFFHKKFGAITYKNDFIFSIKNKKILITHGDGILKNDYLYRFMRTILRNKIIMFLFSLIPEKIGCSIAQKISSTKKKFGAKHILNTNLKEELESFAIKKFKENIDVVLMGHYHQLGIKNINNKLFINLGDWINHFTVTKLTEQGEWKQESF